MIGVDVGRWLVMASGLHWRRVSHFLPLLEVPALKTMLQASAQSGVASLAKLLDWASPQLPVHLRTRGGATPHARTR